MLIALRTAMSACRTKPRRAPRSATLRLKQQLPWTSSRRFIASLKERNPPLNLSITHNSCADRGAQPDIGETGQAAPHHDVPRRRIIGAREVSA